MDSEIPEEGADGASRASCARPDSADRDEHEITILSGKVASDHINVLVAYRPHSGCQPDRAVAERDQFADTPSVSLRTCGRPFGAATWGPGGILPSARGI
jgi:hypothetical protein